MQRGGHHQGKAYLTYALAHQILGSQGVCDDIRKRTIVADRSCENKIHSSSDTAIEYAAVYHPLFHRLSDPARFANRVDCPKVVLVTLAGANILVQINTKRRPIKGGLDVVHRQSITGEKNLHITILDEVDKVSGRAGVHESGAG